MTPPTESGGRGPRGGRARSAFGRGGLQLVLLQLLAEQPRHGYELIKAIEERAGGDYCPSPGVVYPRLAILEETGLLHSKTPDEAGRKRHAITPAGLAYLNEPDNRARVDDLFSRMENGTLGELNMDKGDRKSRSESGAFSGRNWPGQDDFVRERRATARPPCHNGPIIRAIENLKLAIHMRMEQPISQEQAHDIAAVLDRAAAQLDRTVTATDSVAQSAGNIGSPPAGNHDGTSDPAFRQPVRVRHALRFRRVIVAATERITPHLIRITLTGPDLEGFTSPGFDDHCKLFFPDADGTLQLPALNADGTPDLKSIDRSRSRDYTPRHYDAAQNLLTLDFALHEAGPATAWAEQAKVGDALGVGGPRGSFLIPTQYDWHLLAGDDTALPAIWRRLQELPADAKAHVFAEIDSETDQIALPSAATVQITWVHRQQHGNNALLAAIKAADFPGGDYYSWVACESLQAKAIREHLVGQRNANPRWIRASGYWRSGTAGAHDTHE